MGDFEDDDGPSNTLEYFMELATVQDMITNLDTVHNEGFERQYEIFSEILSRYQEQPHLLDPHLPVLVESLLEIIRRPNVESTLFHAAFKYLYQFSKVRTYKVLVKILPHEITDLDLVLNLLENKSLHSQDTWESRYMLLLWLSILVLNPFQMSRFDAIGAGGDNKQTSKMDRIFSICRDNTMSNDTCSSVAAFLAAKYLIRIDIKDVYLPQYLSWVIESDPNDVKFGQLAAISSILKHGGREDLLRHSVDLLKWLLACDFKTATDFLRYKYFVKIIQRLGLVFLKPRLAHWRYQRGSRSLTKNLAATEQDQPANNVDIESHYNQELDDDASIQVPNEVEEVFDALLQGLRSASSDVRWSAAKGLGRVTSRLPKNFGDEVVGSVIEILNPLEQNEAWHGSCLAIAELAKRGLLLPYRLETMVPLLLKAMVYDEMKGYMSVGQHIRDAACYICWAFARAYEPDVIKPFINKIAAGLLVTTVFDREINCRRAASAAFQESVGRLRTFPHGIEILTKADFFSVGIRTNAYLEISNYIAQYADYSFALIDHLIAKKVNHWDTVIRELTAKALHKLTAREPTYMATIVLPKLFEKTLIIDVNTRHGSVLAIGEIVASLKALEIDGNSSGKYITLELITNLNDLVINIQKRNQFKGHSGEMMYHSCCDFIRNCSIARIPVTNECLLAWQETIDACIVKNAAPIRETSVVALKELAVAYYCTSAREIQNDELLSKYVISSREELWEFVRMGYVSAISVLPKFILERNISVVITTLIINALTPLDRRKVLSDEELNSLTINNIENNWSEARRDSVKALSNVIKTIDFDDNGYLTDDAVLDKIFNCLLIAIQEYTIDNRGDIGAWVREASMNALYRLVSGCPKDRLKADIVHIIATGFVQQAVEKIDRTRALAGKLFCKLIYNEKPIPHIKHHEFLKTMFPEDNSNILWLHAQHTFPLFCELLALPEYTESLLIGLIASIGQLTESLIKYSSNSTFDFLRSHPEHVKRVCETIVTIYEKNILNERITCPLLNFLNLLISSGSIDSIVHDANHPFSEDIFRLTKLEIKGHKKLYKLISSISVFCQLIQVPSLSSRVLSYLAIFLGLTHVHVRKCTASKLYEALIIYSDTCGVPEENLDEIMNSLSETDWGLPLTDVRPIRNNLCTLLGIKPPVSAAPPTK